MTITLTLDHFANVVGTLIIQFSIDSAHHSRAADAVANLKRRLLPDNGRSRRSVDTTRQMLMSRVDNQTITTTGIYNWTGALFSIKSRSYSGKTKK